MQIFIGVNLGYQAIVQWRDVLYPQWWLPMRDGFHALIFGGEGSPWGVMWAVVGIIGLLFYLQLSRKYSSLSKIAIGITIGIGAGVAFKSQFGQNIPQILDTFKPLAPSAVKAQPRVSLRLPGSERAPTIDGSLAIFNSGNRLKAVEVLGGVQLWDVDTRGATGTPAISGNDVLLSKSSQKLRFSRTTGEFLGPTAPQPSTLSSVVESDSRIVLKEGDKRIWTSDQGVHLLGESLGRIFGQANGRVLMFDPTDGRQLISIPESVTVPPSMAAYRQPQFSNGVVLLASKNLVKAFAVRDGIAEGVHSGDLLWSSAFDEPITSVQSFDGVALVSGAEHSELWEIPIPRAKLLARDYFDNWVSVITVVCVMTYFFFSFRQKNRVVTGMASTGRWILMVGFGAFFGNTVMTRMSFLLDRLMFLIDDWLRPIWHLIFR